MAGLNKWDWKGRLILDVAYANKKASCKVHCVGHSRDAMKSAVLALNESIEAKIGDHDLDN